MDNRQRLIDLIIEYKLDRRDVAELLKVKRDIVDQRLISAESKNHKEVSKMVIDLLALKLRAQPVDENSPS